MQRKEKKRWIIIVSAALAMAILVSVVIVLILPSSGSRFFSGEAKIYYENLIRKGFPEDYAAELTELHLLHPTWEFEPLLITQQNPIYTWDYIIEKETENGEINVIYASDTYSAYHHLFNKELYDSGYYQASEKTVKYFMDPRNFLNETDIFQFYSLSGGTDASLEAVKAVLAGTFMENAYLENGKTYAAYILEVGRELDINPIFLAAKIRNEQGIGGTSPIISGKCGDRLWYYYQNKIQTNDQGDSVLTPTDRTLSQSELTAYNGYYNLFNIGATGKGLFSIYENAMKRAMTGTSAMASKWGNGGAWNTKWKSIYGGAYFLKTKYIDAYQSTVYLQKFNVDSRANGNFWNQYMTAVFGAMSEGRTLCQSFTTLDALDMQATFLIPVYDNMPKSPSPDPADGKIKNFATEPNRYSYEVGLFEPDRYSAENAAIYLETEVYPAHTLSVEGEFEHSLGLDRLEYAWDGGEWTAFSTQRQWKLSLNADFSENTSHILVIRARLATDSSGRTNHTYCLVSVVYVDVIPIPTAKLSIDIGGSKTNLIYNVGTAVLLPTCEDEGFVGWYGSNGLFFPSGADFVLEEDVTFSAIYVDFDTLSGASIKTDGGAPRLCFSAVLDTASYERLTENGNEFLTLSAILTDGQSQVEESLQIGKIFHREGDEWVLIDASTPIIADADLDSAYSAQFFVQLHYSDGSTQTLSPTRPSSTRSVKQVASAALADRGVTYSESTLSVLHGILANS